MNFEDLQNKVAKLPYLDLLFFSNLSVLLSFKNKGLFIYIMYRINDAFIKQSFCFTT